MKIIAISDTHMKMGLIKGLNEPCDILIHAGDGTLYGTVGEFVVFFDWFKNHPAKNKIFIAGNHDFLCQQQSNLVRQMAKETGVIYLQDDEIVISGWKIYGSPWQPFFYNWAFNASEEQLKQIWSRIPDDVDILVTHGPPYGFLDKTSGNENAGCGELLHRVQKVKPKYHIFGHIHEGYGQAIIGETTFINAAGLNERYEPVNEAISFSIEEK